MGRGGHLTTLGVATACATLGVMPVFLTGALAVVIRQDFPFDPSRLGLAIACFFAASATFSVPGGALSDRMGPRRSLMLSVSGSVLVLGAVASLPQLWTHMLMLMVAGGAVNGLSQPAANLALASTISSHRQGIAFGIKQSAVPGATLLAGISVPVVGATLGWRGAFWAGAVLAGLLLVMAAAVIPDTHGVRAARRTGEEDVSAPPLIPLILVAVGGGLGAAAAVCLGAFLVESAVERALPLHAAGLLLSAGSAVGISGRLLSGWAADRWGGDQLLRVAGMMGLGAVGFGLLSVATTSTLIVAGTILAFGAGWGWAGIYVYALVVLHPHAPGTASGIAQVGAASGAMLGPAAFGAIVERSSFTAGWLVAAASAALAACLLLLSTRLMPEVQPTPEQPGLPMTAERHAVSCGHTQNGDAA